MSYEFKYDNRLGIALPVLDRDWEEYSLREQATILVEWEAHRSDIPERIKQIEAIINAKQEKLNIEENFIRSCELNHEIADLASTINDLNLWFRIQQDTDTKVHM
ncbi:hypothetical protein [Bacillus horti]|uniref:DNA-binding protein YlxM (UPF0122 family) n=1 Tax=Caldalkalibacillus horti TaxID=77523 RepID=A0ABT9W3G9_9BACI|nr:hypothetical protein [Bacillus horti]MDQ0167803.1 putative DNA-binding protein YlxM (UPF0122 family) [Bacillus horti]